MRQQPETKPLHGRLHFNPRTREGCDDTRFIHQAAPPYISIHAPVKGATQTKGSVLPERQTISIHAPVKGATSPSSRPLYMARYFNPRTREGCDIPDAPKGAGELYISIHAPVKGATSKSGVVAMDLAGISIHAPVKGATWNTGLFVPLPGLFQSTHP